MGHRASLKPHRLKRHGDERRTASHAAIQRATFQHLMTLVDDPDQPGQHIPYCELEQRLRGRNYRLALQQQCQNQQIIQAGPSFR